MPTHRPLIANAPPSREIKSVSFVAENYFTSRVGGAQFAPAERAPGEAMGLDLSYEQMEQLGHPDRVVVTVTGA